MRCSRRCCLLALALLVAAPLFLFGSEPLSAPMASRVPFLAALSPTAPQPTTPYRKLSGLYGNESCSIMPSYRDVCGEASPRAFGDAPGTWKPEIVIPGDHTPLLSGPAHGNHFCATRPTRPTIVYNLPPDAPTGGVKYSMRPDRNKSPDPSKRVTILLNGQVDWRSMHAPYVQIELLDPEMAQNHPFQVKCPITCNFLPGGSADGADAVVHFQPGSVVQHRPELLNIAWENEAPYKTIGQLGNHDRMKHFDMVWHWSMSSDIVAPSHDDKFMDHYSHFTDHPSLGSLFCSPGPKTAPALAMTVIGECKSGNNRQQTINELMSLGLTVEKFGGCEGTPKLSNVFSHFTGFFSKYSMKTQKMSEYKFMLAFENDNCQDWITEKVYQAFAAHAVPIYLGAPNIDEVVPPHSIINLRDFPDRKKLVEYIQYLDKNETAYNEYFDWKNSETWRVRSYWPLATKRYQACGACQAVYAERERLKAAGKWSTTTTPAERRDHYKVLDRDKGMVSVKF